MPAAGCALSELNTAVFDELAGRLAQIPGDLSPERAVARLREIAGAFAADPARGFFLDIAATALAAIVALDRKRHQP